MIHIFYGTASTYVDITDKAAECCSDGDRIYIPTDDDLRAQIFSDPAHGIIKNVIVVHAEDGAATCHAYGPNTPVRVNLNAADKHQLYSRRAAKHVTKPNLTTSAEETIRHVHKQVRFTGGSLTDEWPEQRMVVNYLDPKAKVLELGANIGRNTLMIATMLDNDEDLVTLECDPSSVELLRNNRYANDFHFHIEPSALSYRKLVQRGWDTIASDTVPPGYSAVQTITFEELNNKYSIKFDTLVADCEGALHLILQDNDQMLENITTIILESDYSTVGDKLAVEEIFRQYRFTRIHSEPLLVNRASNPFPEGCTASFFEVWRKAGS